MTHRYRQPKKHFKIEEIQMTSAHMAEMLRLSQSRAEAYIHIAKSMVMNDFGPATEHTHTEITIGLAAAMMQHESAQIIADAIRASDH